jgi:hypothetical protein
MFFILVRTGIAKENCLPTAIINATLKIIRKIKPTCLLGNTNLYSQYERKTSKEISS